MIPNIRWRKGDRYIPTLRQRVYSFIGNPQHAVSDAVSIILIISEARARGFIMSVRVGRLILIGYFLVFVLTRIRS
jgi:hypothetical protein